MLYEKYRDQGLMVITLLTETQRKTDAGVPIAPNQNDLADWASQYGQTFPVLSDGDWLANRFSRRGGSSGATVSLPSISLLGPGAVVIIADGDPEESDIQQALP